MSGDARTQVPAREIAAGIRSGRFSALEVVEAHIRRIEAVNPRLNAVVADRFDAARAEARSADREIRGLQPLAGGRPLLGVPFTVKEMIAVAGMPLTFGCRSRVGIAAGRDATVVARLRAAGAIPLGVTNVPEWGMWFESYNSVYGRTRNPWDPGRTPGGSSGGEGAIVGAGGSAFGVGSDIGGSVRIPAAFCGTYGHKPGSGLLPLTGHYPIYADGAGAGRQRKSPYLVIGVLTRSARDIPLLLRAMAGPDGVDPNACAMSLGDADAVDWRGRPVVLLPAPDIARARRASPHMQRAVRRAGRVLEERGAAVTEAPPALLRRAGDAWFAALQSVGGPGFAETVGGADGVRLLPEIAATLFGRGRYSWPALFFCIGEAIGRKGEVGLRRALAEGDRIRDAFARLTGDDGVLVAPASPRGAPRHNEPALFAFDFLYTAAFNALRVPATVAPMGLDGDGLPLGVQVAAARGNDHLTIAAAMALEEAAGPWRPAATAGAA
jgi:fatty acid amide hydrolase 2